MFKALSGRHAVIRCAAVAAAACLGTVGASAQNGAADGEWPVFGADSGATRYSPLDEIHAGNVGDLEVAWRWSARDQGTPPPSGRTQISPIVVNGVLYTTIGNQRSVIALDAATGLTCSDFGDGGTVNGERSLTLGIRRHSVSEQFSHARGVACPGGRHQESRRAAVRWRLHYRESIGDL